MTSITDSKDDSTQATSISFLVLFCLYLPCLAFAAYKFGSSFTSEARIFRVIKGMIVVFLTCNVYAVRTVYWTDPLSNFPMPVYNLLGGAPNILLYYMGQMIAYEW